MRRRDALSVRVRNPSRGLVTRLPTEESDLMRPGDKNRVFTDAQNVRFEDGVIAAAPGYARVELVSSLLEDLVSHWRMDEVLGETREDSHGTNDLSDGGIVAQAPGHIGNSARVSVTTPLSAPDSLTLSMTGTDFTWTGWIKFSTLSNIAAVMSKGRDGSGTLELALVQNNDALLLVASTDGTTFTTITSAVTLTADTWFFVAIRYDVSGGDLDLRVNATVDSGTAASIFNGTAPLVFGGPDGNAGTEDVDSFSFWHRALTDDELDSLYDAGTGMDYPFIPGGITLIQQGNLIDDTTPKPVSVAIGGGLYSVARTYDTTADEFVATLDQIFEGTAPSDLTYAWSVVDFYDKEVYAQHDNVPQFWLPAESATQDVPGLPTSDDKWDGVESFFGHLLLWKGDRIKWSALNDFSLWIPVSQTAASFAMTVDAPGFTQPSPGGSATIPTEEDPSVEGVVVGQFIGIVDVQSGLTYYNYYQVTAITPGTPGVITATLLTLTGATAAASTVNPADTIFSVDANESGELQNVGAHVNGPIYQILAQGDYAYIFKERSIQSVQYVGLASGVFFVHPEIANEGLLARNCLLGLGDGRMVFVGHREIYSYQGGPALTPIIQQFSRQMYSELDRGRLERIVLFHKEFKNEVWIQYPVIGGMKVLIWNYREDTATIDIYPTARDGITAIAEVEWPVDPSWASLADTVTWANFDQSLSWSDMTANGADRFTLMATGDEQLVIHGVGFSRAGEAYTALAETQDFDCDEPDIFKYVDVVLVGLQVKSPDSVVRRVFVQLGYRDWLDGDVTWTPATAIQVQGNFKPPPVKINPGGAGRFLRLRFYSNEINVPWRVTSYEIHTRGGSYY